MALKWEDIDWENGTASVTRAFVKGHIGKLKTEASKRIVPLHAFQLEDLRAWRAIAPYAGDNDWVFGSERMKGIQPLYPDMLLKRYIRPLATKLLNVHGEGITNRVYV